MKFKVGDKILYKEDQKFSGEVVDIDIPTTLIKVNWFNAPFLDTWVPVYKIIINVQSIRDDRLGKLGIG